MDSKINKLIFFTGLGLLILILLIDISIEVLLGNTMQPITYGISKTILAIGATLVFSQIPTLLNVNLPMGIKAAGGIAFGILVYFFEPNFFNRKKTGLPLLQNTAIPSKTKQLRIAILRSGEYEYSYTILQTFLDKIEDSIKYTEYTLMSPLVLTGAGDNYKDSLVMKDFANKVKYMLTGGPFDFFITIGSAASKAFNDYKRNYSYTGKHIFLGVTDPVALNLCNNILPDRSDPDHRGVAGVAYCGNYEELPNKIHAFYPGRKLTYIYNTNIIEDVHLAQRFIEQKEDWIKDSILVIKAINHKPEPKDFNDSLKTVYFSWSTFDDVFVNNYSLINKLKYLVSTTSTHALYGLVPVAISTNDEEIGTKGASLLLKNIFQRLPLEEMDIYVPRWQTFVNLRLAYKSNIPDDIIRTCDVKY